MKNPKFSRAFEVVTELPEPLQSLKTLAKNFYWTWNHETRDLFRSIDKELWKECENNSILFLNRVSPARWQMLATDSGFLARLKNCLDNLDQYMTEETWFDRAFPGQREKTSIAYFCFEFGITEGLPIYSGGLGVLAGDHLKSASDLGLPLVGLGLLYNRGYFRQKLTHDGWQTEVYPQYDFYQMPISLVRDEKGDPIRIPVEFPDRVVTCQIWRADVGRIPLYLLDSNVLENAPADQGITDSLYGGDEEMRIRQEMILGIGGYRALKVVGVNPTVCHMNEGHAAFMSIERIRQTIESDGVDFRTARASNVHGNVFTTHTPVPAGFDLFPADLLNRYLGKYVEQSGVGFKDFMKLGRFDPENEGEPFNMAILAMETANYVGGVARLHGEVSRRMFAGRWPNYPESEVPIGHVTNGIHTMTWVGRRMAHLYDEHCGKNWRRNPSDPAVWAGIDDISDEELWTTIEDQRGALVRYVRNRFEQDRAMRSNGESMDRNFTSRILDPRVLTIGFARRFATYKRGSLMIQDADRLKSILLNEQRPVQIVISGKAHPRDEMGKRLIQELVQFINANGLRHRMVFIEDYDMGVARMLVQGVDVWLNNPRRPYEASGTSGMKVVPNGGLNCSILDGWWDEGYSPEVGFVIGDRVEDPNTEHKDWLDSRALYDVIENQIAPIFYHRVENGIPGGWLKMVRESIKSLAPQFSTHRMVQDYATKFYMPASNSFAEMSANHADKAKAGLAWREKVQGSWPQVRVVSVSDNAGMTQTMGASATVKVRVVLGTLNPDEVKVQVVSGKVGANRELYDLSPTNLAFVANENGESVFEGPVVCDRAGHQGYTIRVVPFHPDLAIPAELNLVCWQ